MSHPEWFLRVAHDLRNPLAPMQTATYLLRSGDIGGEEQARMLEVIDRQGMRLAAMIDELADGLRAEYGRLLGPLVETDLATLVQLAANGLDAAPVELAQEQPLPVLADDARLLQLLRVLRELRLSPDEVLASPVHVERHAGRVRVERLLACPAELLVQPEQLLLAPLPPRYCEDSLGLQLPTAASIASALGGQLQARDQDGMLALVLDLPLMA